jgi:hypothetical protein
MQVEKSVCQWCRIDCRCGMAGDCRFERWLESGDLNLTSYCLSLDFQASGVIYGGLPDANRTRKITSRCLISRTIYQYTKRIVKRSRVLKV